jgi:hypothetical protein
MKEMLANQTSTGYGTSFVNSNNKDANTNNITDDNNSRRYAMLSTEWISTIGEELGMHPLPDSLLKRLAEDASYRLREVLHVSMVNLCLIFTNLRCRSMINILFVLFLEMCYKTKTQ